MLKIAVCVSGGGTNLQAIIDGIEQKTITNTEIAVVISNNPGAYALKRAKKHGIEAVCISPKEYKSRAAFNEDFLRRLDAYEVDLVVLAGFLVVIPEQMIAKYRNRIINIHPSLIPSFCGTGYYGLKVHEGALARGVKVTGATVHFVDEGTDTDHSAESGRSAGGRYAGDPAAPCHGAGRVEDYATGDRPDRKWKSDGDGQNRTYQ